MKRSALLFFVLMGAVAQAQELALHCRFTDGRNRNVLASFRIDSEELDDRIPEGSLQFTINDFAFPPIPVYVNPNDPESTVVVDENGKIKKANVYFDLNSRRAFFKASESSEVLFDFTQGLSDGEPKPAECQSSF